MLAIVLSTDRCFARLISSARKQINGSIDTSVDRNEMSPDTTLHTSEKSLCLTIKHNTFNFEIQTCYIFDYFANIVRHIHVCTRIFAYNAYCCVLRQNGLFH